jgi:SAM-dependent methyltransferase
MMVKIFVGGGIDQPIVIDRNLSHFDPRQLLAPVVVRLITRSRTIRATMASKANGPQLRSDKGASSEDLQRRAVKKLGKGDWSVTSRALQQSTPWQVARMKASWFDDGLVYDLCCGLGGDAIQLLKRGPVVAVDTDAALLALTRSNLATVNGKHAFEVQCADETSIDLPEGVSIHIDPDRRPDEGRTVQPEHYLPPWTDVCKLVTPAKSSIVKLAPAATFDSDGLPPHHRCGISLQGRVREQTRLCGHSIERSELVAGSRSAVSIRADGTEIWYRPGAAIASVRAQTVEKPMQCLIDPDAAIRAAGLTETFADQFELRLLGRASGFLTADVLVPEVDLLAVTGKVIWVGACDDRKLRRQFRAMNVYPQTIKVRGTEHDPAALTKRYRDCGQTPVTLWIGRAGKRVFAAMTNPRKPKAGEAAGRKPVNPPRLQEEF